MATWIKVPTLFNNDDGTQQVEYLDVNSIVHIGAIREAAIGHVTLPLLCMGGPLIVRFKDTDDAKQFLTQIATTLGVTL